MGIANGDDSAWGLADGPMLPRSVTCARNAKRWLEGWFELEACGVNAIQAAYKPGN